MAENRELALVLKLVADQFQSELKKSGGALGEFNKFISDWKVQLTAAGTALFAIAKSTANYGEELLKTSQKIGIKVEALAGLQHAANLADLSNESLSTGLKKLSVNMVDAARQTGDGEALFRRLGVSATDATGQLRPTEQVLLDLADVFANSKDGAGKAEVAVKLFGKAGLDLIPFLNQGKVGIKELMAEAERLGLVLSQQDAEAANKFNDELKKLQAATKGLTLEVGTGLIPYLTEALKLFTEMIPKAKGLGDELSTFSKSMSYNFTQTRQGQIAMDIFTSLGLGHRKGEERTPREQFWNDLTGIPAPGSGARADKPSGEMFGPPAPKGEIAVLADQEKLGKALLEIYLANNRAIDIRNKLAAEGADGYRHLLEFQIQEEKNEEDRQERLGRNIVQQTSLEVKIREDALAKERDGLAQNAQAWLDYHQQVGGLSMEGALGASAASSRGAANPALFGPGFATGGSFRVPGSGGTDTTPVGFWATPGETVDIRTPGQQSGGGGVTVIVNNYGNQDVQTSSSRGSDGKQTIYVTVREIVKGLVQGGEMDAPMGRRFGLNPRPATR